MITLKFSKEQIKEYTEAGFIFEVKKGIYKLFDERENIIIKQSGVLE